MAADVLAIGCAKGGVGKTTTSINFGTATTSGDRSVLLIEVDLAMANVVDFLHLDFDPDRNPTLHDVLGGDVPVVEAIYDAPGGLRVLACGIDIDGYVRADPSRLRDVVDSARDQFDLVLLDTPSGVSRESLLPLGLADGVVLVSTPRLSAVRDARKTLDLVHRVDGTALGLVLTRKGTGSAPPGQRIAEFLGVDLLGDIPEDGAIPRSQDRGEPVVTYAPDAPSAGAYRRTAGRIQELLGEEQAKSLSPSEVDR